MSSKDTQRRPTNHKTIYTSAKYTQTPNPPPYSGRLVIILIILTTILILIILIIAVVSGC